MNRRQDAEQRAESPLRARLHEIIFESETTAGKFFDVTLLILIIASVATVMLESVAEIAAVIGPELRALEWIYTGLFTVEYILRLFAVKKAWRYARSAFGIIDLLAILPSYISLVLPGSQYFLILRVLRLLRVFRIFRLKHFVGEANVLMIALRASRHKIAVFLGGVSTIVIVVGALMYLVEGAENGFTSIPKSVYWAVVTLTTVGYGDIAPQTPLGQSFAVLVMLLGYAIIAVPTGIVSSELVNALRGGRIPTGIACPACSAEGHDPDARFCKYCGASLE